MLYYIAYKEGLENIIQDPRTNKPALFGSYMCASISNEFLTEKKAYVYEIANYKVQDLINRILSKGE